VWREVRIEMAANAYVMLNVDPSRTTEVVDRMRAVAGAVVHEVLGPYDIVVELEADTNEDLTALLRSKIRPVPGVTSTVTCVWM
jgi:DNA-binding Lrp family transcriptional regulator